MKRAIILFMLLVAIQLWAQDKSRVTVKSTEVINRVVLVSISENGRTLELQCNQDQAFCTAPKPGTYQMVRLPKNRGMYDCNNADLFAETADPANDQKIGEYCLNEK
jgi:hypothetical protein